MAEKINITIKEYKSGQEVRWCPGCGDHAILNAVQKAMVELKQDPHKIAVISGIGCSSRFPYYMNTFGIHGIHGRAPAIASGVKVANPKLHVWQITGDGDALAIGGNHFIHEIRRNIDINVILFNNKIYGLTKGQYSPTSEQGAITKSSPFGTVEQPFRPGELTIGARGKFFARALDSNIPMLVEVLIESAKHQGTSIVEVLQNCVIFNDKTHKEITDKANAPDRQLYLKHGEPMIFGKNKDKGIILDGNTLKVVEIGKNGITEKDILVHDAHGEDTDIHLKLANMAFPDYPVAFGVIRAVSEPTYDQKVEEQIRLIKEKSSIKSLKQLLYSGDTWVVE